MRSLLMAHRGAESEPVVIDTEIPGIVAVPNPSRPIPIRSRLPLRRRRPGADASL